MQKKVLFIIVAIVLSAGLFAAFIAGGGSKGSTPEDAVSTEGGAGDGAKPSDAAKGGKSNVAILINGNRGDKAFFDSAANAAVMIKDLGCTSKVVEMTYDETKWMPTLIDFSEDASYDTIIVGTWQMAEKLHQVAPDYPDKKYIIFDSAVDYELPGMENVYSIEYMQNECSFLAGAVAALSTKTGTIGFVGGMENYVINDFLLGYIQGAKHVNPGIKINIAYIGSFNDSARAKELTLAQINQKADVVYQVASTAGLGVIDACLEKGKWAIGVDGDQAEAFRENDPDKANIILTSALKRVDESLYRAMKLQVEGDIQYGQRVVMGLADGAVSIAKNDIYKKNVPADAQARIDDLEKQILDGTIKVDTAFGKTTDEIEAIRASVRR